MEVADGKTTKKTPKAKAPLPWGAVRIRWPEDADFAEGETFVWSVLRPCDWNHEVPMGWRYTAAELQRSREARKQ